MINARVLHDRRIEVEVKRVEPEIYQGFVILLNAQELLELKRAITDVGFEYAKKFKCSLDDPECK